MDLESLQESPLGQLVPISGVDGRTGQPYDYFSYLANPLPRRVDLTSETWMRVSSAEVALARLDQAASLVPGPSLLREPALRREAQSTSALEGTFAPFEDVLESDVEERALLPMEIREVLNYVVAAEEAFGWIAERPLTTGLIENLQRILVQGTPAGECSDAGKIRDRQVFIGLRDEPIEAARFVPAPFGDQLHAGIDDWMSWVNDPPDSMTPVVQAALAHYQFETLHPFSDGNGRIGRLLIVLQLMRQKVLQHPILVVSPWFEARREQYQDALLKLSQDGDWDAWARFFAEGVGVAALTTHSKVVALLSWRERTIQRVRQARVSGVAERLAGELIGAPVLRAAHVAAAHGVSHQGAIKALRRLVALGILHERARKGQVLFIAPDVVELLRQ